MINLPQTAKSGTLKLRPVQQITRAILRQTRLLELCHRGWPVASVFGTLGLCH